MNYPLLTELLPHRPPMLLIGSIRSHDPSQTVCVARFSPGDVDLLGDGSVLPATLALELVAQTMAVHDGLRRRDEHRPATSSGLLLGSRRFELLARTLPVGEDLSVTAVGEDHAGGGGLVRFTGRVENGRGEVLASGDVTVLEHRPA